jgi:aminoglycoside phosphotransferase (APT) family kinase protein
MARRVAEAIHKLHRTQLPTDRTHGMEDELGILGNALVKVAMERPQWRARLKRLFEACRRLAASVAPVIPVGIHRDFYHDQLLVNGRQVYLLDLDLYCLGDPALDIGNFVAHLQEQSLRETGDLNALDDTAGVLIEHYQRLEGREMRASIEAYRLLSLVRHITISRRIPERHPFTDKLLEICEEQLMALGFYRHAMTGT